MIDKDQRVIMAEMAQRIERLEAVVVLLCEEASHGKGSQGKPFWAFIDTIRQEHYAAS